VVWRREDGGVDPKHERALVLAGGGVTGIAWHLGLLLGLERSGLGLGPSADLIIGTSAGATVAAQITSGESLEQLVAEQTGAAPSAELPVDYDRDRQNKLIGDLIAGATSANHARARIGAMALAAPTVPEKARRDVIAARLPIHSWPDIQIRLIAVNADSGELVVFDRSSGVSLVDAVAASCAVPGVWPPVSIGSQRYVDGGVRSLTNADLAAGYRRVAILIPMPLDSAHRTRLELEARRLGPNSEIRVVTADRAALTAMGPNSLDPARRRCAARAGLRQAADAAPLLVDWWT
jgi:NTE family protein